MSNTFVFICLFSCYRIVETIFKMKLNILVTKYINILIFKFAYISSAMHNATFTLTFQWERNALEISQQNTHWETGLFKRIIHDSFYICIWKKVLDVCIYILTGNIKDELKDWRVAGAYCNISVNYISLKWFAGNTGSYFLYSHQYFTFQLLWHIE